jgi:hypothetical protein
MFPVIAHQVLQNGTCLEGRHSLIPARSDGVTLNEIGQPINFAVKSRIAPAEFLQAWLGTTTGVDNGAPTMVSPAGAKEDYVGYLVC